MSLQSRIDYSIDLLRRAEPLALKMHPDGFHLAFSGGKDSQVLYHIAQMAGVKFHAHMQITTLDPPELMRFVHKNYPDVELHRPPMNFFDLIKKKKMLPLMHQRYCCEALKEHAGAGSVTLVGVRAAESVKRSKRAEVERTSKNKDRRKQYTDQNSLFNASDATLAQCVRGRDRIVVSPIFRWSNADVWGFIRSNGIEYCSLYDEGFHRIGCMFCPAAAKRSIQWLIDNVGYGAEFDATADEVFDWYCSGKNQKTYFGNLRAQTKIEF